MKSSRRVLLSHRHPVLYALAIHYHRIRRSLSRWKDTYNYASRLREVEGAPEERVAPFLVKRHSSRLLKKLGAADMHLQHNKVTNIELCLPHLNGLVLEPGEAFSFHKLVGRPTRRRGFLNGIELSMGKAQEGVGGGICQIANLLHWLVLHSPLTVVERSSHSFDPFPDHHRAIPFGTGCALFYNYVDFRFVNETEETFQLKLWTDKEKLWGELRSGVELAETYKVFEKNHAFVRREEDVYRKNEIWRKVSNRQTGMYLRDEFLKKNDSRVMYQVDEENISEEEANEENEGRG